MWRIVVVTYLQQPAAAGPCQHHPGSRISTPTFPGTRHLHGRQCHASPGDNGKPSIATLVSSVDAAYSAVIRIQMARKDVISSLSNMINFYHKTGFKSLKIVMDRDGFSEVQFNAVFQFELLAIRQACMDLEQDYRPGLTFIVVQKRDQSGWADNILEAPGPSPPPPTSSTWWPSWTSPTRHEH